MPLDPNKKNKAQIKASNPLATTFFDHHIDYITKNALDFTNFFSSGGGIILICLKMIRSRTRPTLTLSLIVMVQTSFIPNLSVTHMCPPPLSMCLRIFPV